MSRIISDLQKREVFKAIPSTVAIGDTTVSASKIWANQKLTSYPTITLNFSNDGIPALVDVVEGVQYYQATLTVHVLADTVQKIPGAILAEAFANQIVSVIGTWIEPLAENIRIFDIEGDISSVRNMGSFENSTTTDLVFSIKIYHE